MTPLSFLANGLRAPVEPQRHPDPFKAMGQILDQAEASVGYIAPRRDMPMALMAKTCRDAASAIVRADDPGRARAQFLDTMAGTLDRAIADAEANKAEIARMAGL